MSRSAMLLLLKIVMNTNGCRWCYVVVCRSFHCHEALSKSANKPNAPSKTLMGVVRDFISTAHIAALLGTARQTTWHAEEDDRED